jgi:diguanylate cyclase (GGDEF)-like protein
MTEASVRILLVDAEQSEYMLIAHLAAAIRPVAHQVSWCNRQEAALAAMISGEYDVILLDCQSDFPAARELLTAAVADGCTAPIVVLSDVLNTAIDTHAIADGAADYLLKSTLDALSLERCIRYACERKRTEQRLARQSQHDPLTGLPNRFLFRDRLERAVERTQRSNSKMALLHVDLDGFRRVNESFGHSAGDQLVQLMAQRLAPCVRKTDSVARIGSDEFAIVLEDVRGLPDVVAVANKIVDAMSQPYTIDDTALVLATSIGIAVFPEAGSTPDTLMRNADLARLKAKQLRGSHYHFYTEKMNLEAMSQMHLESELRRALRRNEFELFYQPRVELESGEIIGVEALIRWRHPQRGLLTPNDFIPLAEDVGLIIPIGYWVIQQALRDLRDMRNCSGRLLDIAINLSFKQLQDEKFVETASRLLRDSGIDPHRVEFELTETAILVNAERTYEGMLALSQLGASFSLDDFGTGYSSFAHIQRLPIAALKIDRSFVRHLPADADDAIIVKAIINLAHSLQLHVIAEGVETLEQVQFLWQNHCDQVQGYYFSSAVALEHLVMLLEEKALASM